MISGTDDQDRMDERSGNPNFVTALARGLAVIKAFDETRPRMTLAQVAHAVNLPRAAARRSLLTLTELGYVASDGKLFWLTPATLQLGFSYLASQPLSQIAQPYINALRDKFDESSSVSVWDAGEIVYIARAIASRLMSSRLNLGSRLPAYCTSMGRILLSALDEDQLATYFKTADLVQYTNRTVTDEGEIRAILAQVRAQGYCIVDQEREIGLRSIAVPVRSRGGKVVAALNISGQSARVEIAQMRADYYPEMQQMAAAMALIMPE